MKITVIVPYKNAAEYIERCADSLRKQEGDFEFIFVNDHSDNGPEQIKTDERFVLIDNGYLHRQGVSGARNAGIDRATGEWITFLDVDDVLLPDAYKKFTDAIEADPDANVHQFNHIRNYPAVNKRTIKFINREGRYDMPNPPNWWFGVWNKLFRTEFIRSNQIRFDESLQYGEDGFFVINCYRHKAYIHQGETDVTTVEHYLHKDSLSHSKNGEDVLNQITTYLDLFNYEYDPDIRLFMCQELSRLFGTPRIQRLISNGKV